MSESEQLAGLKEQLNTLAKLLGRDIYDIKQQLSSKDLPPKVKQILNKGYYDE